MRRTLFNEPVLQPGDDIYAAWTDLHGDAPDEAICARFIEADEGKWGCELSDGSYEMQANDFETEDALRAWLAQQKIEIDE